MTSETARQPFAVTDKPHIVLAVGDAAGIGPEIVVTLLSDPQTARKANVTLIANMPALEAAAISRGVALPAESDWLSIPQWPGLHRHITPAEVSEANGVFILESLKIGVEMVATGRADALCFGPLNKGAMRMGGMRQEDEMRWLSSELNYTGVCGEFNVLDRLWTARVTSHIPLSAVAGQLSAGKVAQAIGMLMQALKDAGVAQPKIGVCGLNPHNGDNGNYGDEEGRIITPGIELAAAEGNPAEGPFPADTIFLRAKEGQFDGIVSMYHDQGQIATKMMGFDIGVTVQGGLPIPVTTPAHGTAYEIVGKGVAKTTAMVNAFDLACRMGIGHRQKRA